MNNSWSKVRRALILLALGGSTLGVFGTFGIGGSGCNYALFKDYETLFQGIGNATIQAVSDGLFGNFGTTFDDVVRTPATQFAQSVWSNWVAARVPNDVELK
jgi:hypothetical protein